MNERLFNYYYFNYCPPAFHFNEPERSRVAPHEVSWGSQWSLTFSLATASIIIIVADINIDFITIFKMYYKVEIGIIKQSE